MLLYILLVTRETSKVYTGLQNIQSLPRDKSNRTTVSMIIHCWDRWRWLYAAVHQVQSSLKFDRHAKKIHGIAGRENTSYRFILWAWGCSHSRSSVIEDVVHSLVQSQLDTEEFQHPICSFSYCVCWSLGEPCRPTGAHQALWQRFGKAAALSSLQVKFSFHVLISKESTLWTNFNFYIDQTSL